MKLLKDKPLSVAVPIIKEAVARYYNIYPNDIDLNTRKREIVIARQIAQYFALFCRNATLTKVGNEIGNKDHATALHSKKEIEKALEVINNRIVDEDIYHAVGFVGHYIKENIQKYELNRLIQRNKRKRHKLHLRRIIKHYYMLKKKYINSS